MWLILEVLRYISRTVSPSPSQNVSCIWPLSLNNIHVVARNRSYIFGFSTLGKNEYISMHVGTTVIYKNTLNESIMHFNTKRSSYQCSDSHPIIKTRQSHDRLIVTQGIPIPRRMPHIDPSHRFNKALHNIPQRTILWQKCAHFCYKMVHCGISDWCIVGFVQQVYWNWSQISQLRHVIGCSTSTAKVKHQLIGPW